MNNSLHNSRYNVTMIEDLPEIDELEEPKTRGMNMIPPDESRKFDKFIRNNNYKPSAESGMLVNPRSKGNNLIPNHNMSQNMSQDMMHTSRRNHSPIHNMDPGENYNSNPNTNPYVNMNPYINMNHNMNPYMNPYMTKKNKIYSYENEENNNIYENYEKLESGANCLSVANHAENCPVCCKLYKQDRTVYIIAISILSIICILLLKKILDI